MSHTFLEVFMAAMPNDIAASQADALNPSLAVADGAAPVAEAAKPQAKKPKAKKEGAPATGEASVAAAEPAVQEVKKAPAQKPAEANAPKKERTPWYIERSERQLRQRDNQSIVFMTKKLVLQSHHAQDVLERTGKNWSEAMITLSETMRNFKPEDQCVVVDAEVDRLMEECLKSIKATSVRLNATADLHGIDMDSVEIEYTKPKEFLLKILSPREYRFHALLTELDSLCALLDKLWLMKLVPDRSRSQVPFETKRQIMRLVNRVRTLVYRAQASSQRAGARDATDPRVGTVLDPNVANAPSTSTLETTDGAGETQAVQADSTEHVATEAA
ncbi:hypothetical protein LJR129_005020 [Acidovorax sp. LjRoot129]|uniref:hypothetical protein n=1 Tax=Acidovorax sp. LjRoot129 TaxID=3342260 RepID=UPI003ECFD8E5